MNEINKEFIISVDGRSILAIPLWSKNSSVRFLVEIVAIDRIKFKLVNFNEWAFLNGAFETMTIRNSPPTMMEINFLRNYLFSEHDKTHLIINYGIAPDYSYEMTFELAKNQVDENSRILKLK